MSFTQIPSLISFSPLTTILSADVNANNAAIRNAFNGLVSGTNTISVDTITENTLNAGVTFSKPFHAMGGPTFTTGFTTSGVAVFTSGISITAGNVGGGDVVIVSGVAKSQVGTSTATAKSRWVLSQAQGLHVTAATNTLVTYTLATGALSADGQAIIIKVVGYVTGSSVASPRITFGGIDVGPSATATLAGAAVGWWSETTVVRTGSATETYVSPAICLGGFAGIPTAPAVALRGTLAVDTASAIVIQVIGQAATATTHYFDSVSIEAQES